MTSDRVARRIERLLDEAEDALDARDWQVVLDRADLALTLDPDQVDARALKAAAERALSALGASDSSAGAENLGEPFTGGPSGGVSVADNLAQQPKKPYPEQNLADASAAAAPRSELISSSALHPVSRQRVNLGGATYEFGSFGARLTAQLLDSVFFGLLVGLVLIVLFVAVQPGSEDASQPGLVVVSAWLLLLAVQWVFESLGQSPGKRAVGLRVLRADGRAPGGSVGLGRLLSKYISAFPFALGYLWAAWDSRSQTWHDKLAGTYVVRSASLHAPEVESVAAAVREDTVPLDAAYVVLADSVDGTRHYLTSQGTPSRIISDAKRYASRAAAEQATSQATGQAVWHWRAVRLVEALSALQH